MEKIKCAAIKYKLNGESEEKYTTGQSHADCINCFSFMDIPARERDRESEIQGFMTDSGRFVCRQEAREIALISGQINKNYPYNELYSEYINW